MPRKKHTSNADLNTQNKLTYGLISERFPSVSGMVINITYYHKGINPVLMLRTINVFPTDCAYFKAECVIKGCDGGGYEITPIIVGMVKAHKKASKGKLVCSGKVDSNACDHASIAYEIGIKYK